MGEFEVQYAPCFHPPPTNRDQGQRENFFFPAFPLLLCRAVLCYFSETFCFSIIILFGYNKVNFISSQFLITDSTLKVQKISTFDSFGFEMLMECFFFKYIFSLEKKKNRLFFCKDCNHKEINSHIVHNTYQKTVQKDIFVLLIMM